MPDPSPFSRVLLGMSLTVAIVLIMVVVSSRPSISKQDVQSLHARSDDAKPIDSEPQATRKVPEVESADNTGKDPSSSVDRESTIPRNRPSVGVEDPADDNAEASVPVQLAKTPADEAMDSVAAEADANATTEVAEASYHTDAEKQSDGKRTEKQEDDIRIDPFKRLSREFARRAARGGVPAKATPAAPPANELFWPSVAMSQEHRKSCLVFIGDSMPDGKPRDGAGKEYSLAQLPGDRLTVIVFWNTVNPYALDQFEELERDLVPFQELGVKTVAIHVGPQPDEYTRLCQEFGQKVLCLADPDEAYFQKVTTAEVPRTYLLDASGKIIWLDIEYSRTTRYDLRNALHYSLQEPKEHPTPNKE